MTGKERAGLRAMANTIQPIFQIGKGGISDAMVEQIGLALDARELIKITVLLGAEPVQCIGRKITIYRRNEKEPKINL